MYTHAQALALPACRTGISHQQCPLCGYTLPCCSGLGVAFCGWCQPLVSWPPPRGAVLPSSVRVGFGSLLNLAGLLLRRGGVGYGMLHLSCALLCGHLVAVLVARPGCNQGPSARQQRWGQTGVPPAPLVVWSYITVAWQGGSLALGAHTYNLVQHHRKFVER